MRRRGAVATGGAKLPDLINADNFFVSPGGNISTGTGGLDDRQGDATYPWAKSDCWVHIDPLQLPAAAPTTNVTEANARTGAGRWNRTYTATGAVNSFIYVPLPLIYRTLAATTLLDPKTPAGAHGFMIKSMVMAYGVTTLAITTATVAFQRAVAFLDAAAIPAINSTPLGATMAYQEPPGTVVTTLPVAASATPYVVAIVPPSPVWFTTVRDAINAEINLVAASSSVITLYDIWFNVLVALV